MSQVQLYVYDLSNGLARQLSKQLTGRQIDGIWHTSVVAYGKEIFYGDGISITRPGQSHHGSPLQVVNMGETSIDEETFDEYLAEIRDHYTADKYHLLDFNCNSFTNDCVGFLTGGSIPNWIKDLPSDFLSTPFGAALRPTIDSMFRRPTPGTVPTPPQAPSAAALSQAASASPDPALASALLQAVASQAYSSGSLSVPSLPRSPAPAASTVASPIHICTNPSSLHGLLQSHRAAVVFFTSVTCGPCKMIEPVFEQLAHQKTHGINSARTAFVKVDMAVGMGSQVGAEWGVRVTPTFLFFLDSKKLHELKGVNAPELRTQVDLLLYQAFPPHPHTKLSLPAVEALSTNPILFKQVPALDTVSGKLTSFMDVAPSSAELNVAKKTLTGVVLPYLKSRFPEKNASASIGKKPALAASPQLLMGWASATKTIVAAFPPAQIFPLVDMWRVALLDEPVANWFTSAPTPSDPLQVLLDKAYEVFESADPAVAASGRNYLLTLLRLLANGFAHGAMTQALMSRAAPGGKRAQVTRAVVATLLHADAGVRTAAASLAFNVAATLQRSRVEKLRGAATGVAPADVEEDEEWEVELVSAVLEALSNEVQSEEVVHRLVAALAFLVRLSPSYDGQLKSLLEVLQSRDTVRSKLAKGGCGEGGVQKAEVCKLIEEVVEKLLA